MAEVARAKTSNSPNKHRRQLLGNGNEGQQQQQPANGSLLSGLMGMIGGNVNSTSSLGDLFQGAVSGLTGDLVGGLATPAFFLGIGLG